MLVMVAERRRQRARGRGQPIHSRVSGDATRRIPRRAVIAPQNCALALCAPCLLPVRRGPTCFFARFSIVFVSKVFYCSCDVGRAVCTPAIGELLHYYHHIVHTVPPFRSSSQWTEHLLAVSSFRISVPLSSSSSVATTLDQW